MGRAVAESVVDNAVVTKEFRTRMRGWKPFAIMAGYVLLLVIVLAIAFWEIAAFTDRSGSLQYQSFGDKKYGMALFGVLTTTQVILLTLVLPSLTASSLTSETERKTIDMLALSKLSSGKIVIGKHLAGFLYALMLLACSMPLAGLCMMLGGISPAEVAVTYLVMAAWAFMFTSAGVMWSTLFRKTAAATLCSYGTCLAYMLFSAIACGAAMAAGTFFGSGRGDVFAFAVMNPAYAPYAGLSTANVCGLHVCVSLITAIMQVAIGALAIMIASSHVCYRNAERPLSIRLMLMGITCAVFFLLAGDHWLLGTTSSTDLREWLAVLSIGLIVALGLGAAAFACGEIRKPKVHMSIAYGLSLRRVFTNDLAGASVFMLLWSVLSYAAIGLGFRFSVGVGSAPADAAFWTAYWEVGVALPAIVLGLSALGIMFSALSARRRTAMALTVIAVVALFLVYLIMLIGYDRSSDESPVWQLAVLWPVMPVMTAIGEWKNLYLPRLSYENTGWLASAAAYLIMAAIALAAAGHFHSKGMGVREED